jgi:hypothetical protein
MAPEELSRKTGGQPDRRTTRRDVLWGLAIGIPVLGDAPCRLHGCGQPGILPVSDFLDGGCLLRTPDKRLGDLSLMSPSDREMVPGASSGNARLDSSLGHVLASIAARFDVRPSFGFFDDAVSPNALATPETEISGTEGSVFFGRTLLGEQLPMSEDSVVGICAHEFGHIVQYFKGFRDRLMEGQSTVRQLELHADFLAGYYLAEYRRDYGYDELRALGKAWASMGDVNFNRRTHHGTPEERLNAIQAGFKLAHEHPEFTIAGAAEVGVRYVAAN